MSIVKLPGPSSHLHERLGPLAGFRPDVQALRGLAVLLVVLYHAGGIVPAGFVGVDVFFVISGFVVGRLLVTDIAVNGTFDWRRFYARRIRRLLPALALMLAVVLLLTPAFAAISVQKFAVRTGIAAGLFHANLYLLNAGGGYFDPKSEVNPFLHTWSLSIEEQFYVLFPLVMTVALWRLFRRFDRLAVLRVIVGFTGLLSFALCVVVSDRGSVFGFNGERVAYYLPFTRAWEFTVGVGLTLLPRHVLIRWVAGRGRRSSVVMTVLGVGLVIASAFVFENVTPFPGYAAMVPVVGTALAIFAGGYREVGDGNSTANLDWSSPFRWMGDVSYSWYLWHWPVIVFVGAIWIDHRWALVAAAVVSLAPSLVSYRIVESRFRRSSIRVSHKRLLSVLVTCILLPVAIGAGAGASDYEEKLFPATETVIDGLQQHRDIADRCDSTVPMVGRLPWTCRYGNPDGPRVLLIGDSNAGHFSETFIGAANELDLSLRIVTSSGCPLPGESLYSKDRLDSFNEDCQRWIRETMRYLEKNPFEIVIVASATRRYFSFDESTSLFSSPPGYEEQEFNELIATFEAGMESVVRRLVNTGAKVVIAEVVPEIESANLSENSAFAISKTKLSSHSSSSADILNWREATRLEGRVAEATGASLWKPTQSLCPTGVCQSMDGDTYLWRDFSHITVQAAERLIPSASEFLRGVLESTDAGS